MAASYAPVELAKQMKEQVGLIKTIPETEHWEDERYINALLAFHSGTYPESPDVQAIDRFFRKTIHTVMSTMQVTKEQITSGRISMLAEWTDIFLTPQLIYAWSKSKQVFKPDSSFAEALLTTKKLQYTKETFKRLPCHDFYIDLEDCPLFKHIHGLFLATREDPKNNGVHINMLVLAHAKDTKEKYITFSHYSYAKLNEDQPVDLDMNELTNIDYEYWTPWSEQMPGVADTLTKLNENKLQIMPFMLGYQMIAYLSLEKPELTESPVTKFTYRPRKPDAPIKNKFSEVQIMEVGIRYGSDFRKKIKNLEKEQKKHEATGTKRQVKPHFRCAHWHYHRVGKGRTELKLMWHEPTFVTGNITDNADMDVVIHRIQP